MTESNLQATNTYNPIPSVAVLVTSVSGKIPLISAVAAATEKLAREGRVFGGDCDTDCLGKHFVDGFWHMPIGDSLIVDDVLSWCRLNRVSVIFPSRDGELAFWARNRATLSRAGVHVMISEPDTVKVCLDKLAFYHRCETAGFPVIPAYETIDQLQAENVVVKERYGAGSVNAGIGVSRAEAERLSLSMNDPIFQPYIRGHEVSVDLYVCSSGDVRGVVLRRREKVVGGESQVTATFHNEEIATLCSELAKELSLRGHAMFQLIIDEKGSMHVIECNCRFGGASTLSLAAGLDSFYWYLLEVHGKDLDDYPSSLVQFPLRQIRFAADRVVAV